MRRRKTAHKYIDFQARYQFDPAAFVVDCIRWERGKHPADYQLEILTELIKNGRYAIRGPHTIGKTSLASWAIHWFALTRDGQDWKIPTTASSWAQLARYLWPELHKWARFLNWAKIGREPYNTTHELLTLNLRLSTGEAFAITSDQPELIEGAHADHLLYVYDEAKAIPDATWDATEGAFAGAGIQEGLALAISTPGEMTGRFYEIHAKKPGLEDWKTRHVKKQEAISAGRMGAEWAAQKAVQWGANSAVYLNRVEGEFAKAEAGGLIPLSWVELSNENWREWQEAGKPGRCTSLGCDVGGGMPGSDLSTIAPCFDGVKVDTLIEFACSDPNTATMELVGQIVILRKLHRGGTTCIDTIGIGTGAYNRLYELGEPVIPFVASAGTDLTDKAGIYRFSNWRSAGWWLLRELLDPDNRFRPCLPPDDALTGEITSAHYKILSNGIIQVEGKDIIKRRIGRSTDHADAVIHALFGQLLNDERIARQGGGQVEYNPVQIGPEY